MVQGLRLYALNMRGPGSIPGQGTRSHRPQLNDAACPSEDRRSHMLQARPGAAKHK